MTIFFGNTVDSLRRIEFTLGEEVITVSTQRDVEDTLRDLPNENLLLIGAEIPLENARSLAEKYRFSRPQLGIIVIRNRLDITILNDAIRSGIREVVGQDDAASLVEACRRSIEISQKQSNANLETSRSNIRGKTILVFSAKGGCGKTTLSINLACALANDPETRVALVDFDLQFGDVAVALQLDPERNISQALSMTRGVDLLGLNSLLVERKPNLSILLAPTNPSDVELITGELAQSLLNRLEEEFDYIIVDSPPAFTDVILRSFDMSDLCLLLTTLDMPALKNLKVSINTLDAIGISESKRTVIVNRSDAKAGLEIKDVEESIGSKVMGRIPTSQAVPATTNRGQAIVEVMSRHKVSREIKSIANLARELTGGKPLPRKKSIFRNKKESK